MSTPTSTIAVGTDRITLINVFTVDPSRQTELVDALDASTQKIFVTMPGFISANLHVGIDGTRVVNYAQWTSEQAYKNAMSRDDLREHLVEIASIAESYDPTLVHVHAIHHAQGS
ncbi:MAG: antibiotic biosynthesis monooxygenase family protein [Pseudonocardia sediminis]